MRAVLFRTFFVTGEVRKIVSGRDDCDLMAHRRWEVLEITRYQPGSCRVGEREERRVFRIGARIRK